eukprot:TRINITY_DN1173_c0_g1_i4.p1 TRINITY_DN1173_c0_g1~~TRINITY_DN1173_c0_g1_i4.p1  ORF type:complete len:634 (+),score=151.06 TRINITY_DN1173_c0_g1_i4:4192-6093(+)
MYSIGILIGVERWSTMTSDEILRTHVAQACSWTLHDDICTLVRDLGVAMDDPSFSVLPFAKRAIKLRNDWGLSWTCPRTTTFRLDADRNRTRLVEQPTFKHFSTVPKSFRARYSKQPLGNSAPESPQEPPSPESQLKSITETNLQLSNDLAAAMQEMESIRAKMKALEEDAAGSNSTLSQSDNDAQQMKKKLSQLQAQADLYSQSNSKLEKQLKELEEEKRRTDNRLHQTQRELEELQAAKSKSDAASKSSASAAALESHIEDLKRKFSAEKAELEKEISRMRPLASTAAALEEEMKDVNRQLEKVRAEKKELQSDASEIASKLKKLQMSYEDLESKHSITQMKLQNHENALQAAEEAEQKLRSDLKRLREEFGSRMSSEKLSMQETVEEQTRTIKLLRAENEQLMLELTEYSDGWSVRALQPQSPAPDAPAFEPGAANEKRATQGFRLPLPVTAGPMSSGRSDAAPDILLHQQQQMAHESTPKALSSGPQVAEPAPPDDSAQQEAAVRAVLTAENRKKITWELWNLVVRKVKHGKSAAANTRDPANRKIFLTALTTFVETGKKFSGDGIVGTATMQGRLASAAKDAFDRFLVEMSGLLRYKPNASEAEISDMINLAINQVGINMAPVDARKK